MISISAEQIESIVKYQELIGAIEMGFKSNIVVPQRSHYDFANPKASKDSTLLLMPAWESGKYVGVKIITISPENGQYDLPSIQGTYLLYDAHKGTPLANLAAKKLTVKRTAATSAFASKFLSRKDSKTLLMIGTGALSPELIRAHASVRPIERVLVWGRDLTKALKIAESLILPKVKITAIETVEEGLADADIISCATLSQEPIIHGADLKPGQHIDLVGSYKPDMREADDDVIRRASVYVDTMDGATRETGDIKIPLDSGVLKRDSIKADLFDIAANPTFRRKSEDEITMFKSVGHALEDLVAAEMIYKKLN